MIYCNPKKSKFFSQEDTMRIGLLGFGVVVYLAICNAVY